MSVEQKMFLIPLLEWILFYFHFIFLPSPLQEPSFL